MPDLTVDKDDIPVLPGIGQNGDLPRVILAQDINYFPFAYLEGPEETGGDFELAGVVVDVVKGM